MEQRGRKTAATLSEAPPAVSVGRRETAAIRRFSGGGRASKKAGLRRESH